MKNLVQLLMITVAGTVIAKVITNKTVDRPVSKPTSQLNGFIDPYNLGLGCECDLGFVGCEDLGVGPAADGIGAVPSRRKGNWLPKRSPFQSPPLINWERLIGRREEMRQRAPSQFSLKGTELGQYLSPTTLERMNGVAYPWGASYDGMGSLELGKFSFKKAIKNVTKPLQKAVTMVKRDVKMVSKVALSPIKAANKVIAAQLKKGVQIVKRDVQHVNKTVQGGFNALIATTGGKTPFNAANSNRRPAGDDQPTQSVDAGGQIEYQDADGNVITKAEYDRQMSYESPPFVGPDTGPGGRVVTDYQDASGNSISKDEFDAINEEAYADMEGKPAWQKRDAVINDDELNVQTGAEQTAADDQNWRSNQGDGFVDGSFNSGSSYNSGGATSDVDAGASDISGIIVDADGMSWWKDEAGRWMWFDERAKQWFADADQETAVSDDGDGLGKFSWKKINDIGKRIASRTTVSGFLYERLKKKSPRKYKELHRTIKTATPYATIAAGVVLEVVSLGTATPAAVALIAGGAVAAAGAQAYTDVQAHNTAKRMDRIQNESDADVVRYERESVASIERTRIAQAASDSLAAGNDTAVPERDWWNGDVDEQSALTYGETLENAGI